MAHSIFGLGSQLPRRPGERPRTRERGSGSLINALRGPTTTRLDERTGGRAAPGPGGLAGLLSGGIFGGTTAPDPARRTARGGPAAFPAPFVAGVDRRETVSGQPGPSLTGPTVPGIATGAVAGPPIPEPAPDADTGGGSFLGDLKNRIGGLEAPEPTVPGVAPPKPTTPAAVNTALGTTRTQAPSGGFFGDTSAQRLGKQQKRAPNALSQGRISSLARLLG